MFFKLAGEKITEIDDLKKLDLKSEGELSLKVMDKDGNVKSEDKYVRVSGPGSIVASKPETGQVLDDAEVEAQVKPLAESNWVVRKRD